MKGKGGFPGGMQQLMKQANQMQSRLKKRQEELQEATYQGTSGGGAVQVTVTGDYQLSAIQIDEDVFKDGDAEMLQDMVMSAANDALKKAKETSESEIEKITGGMNVPGLF